MISHVQKKKYQAYVNATQTVAKTRQIVMLYDGAIRFLQQAQDAMREGRIEDRFRLLVKASEIVVGLQSCLDFENGGSIAKVLYSFYSTVDSKIFSMHHSGSIDTCNEVIADLKQMRDVWDEIDQSAASAEGDAKPAEENAAPSAQAAAPAADPNISLSA